MNRRPHNVAPALWTELKASGLSFAIASGKKHDLLTVAGKRVAVLSRCRKGECIGSRRLDKMAICAIRRLKEGQDVR